MNHLFDVIPDNFFRLLTGPNRKLYAESVLLLFEQAQKERFGIRYDMIRDIFQELIESRRELGEALTPEYEESEGQSAYRANNGQQDQVTLEELSRSQANTLIRRLASLGWVQIEVRDQFEQYIVLPHYTNRLLSLFQELCEDRAVEYQRFAFVTYQLLTGDESQLRPAFAVREAYHYTKQFQQELITLYQNMKHHMEQIIQKTTIEEVLEHHFETYKSQIVDKSYHRLKTSDHVSRYRVQILDHVQKWLLDKDLVEETVQDGMASEFYQERDEAYEDVRGCLLGIETIYGELDDMFYSIDRRHNQYLRSSYDRARYLSQQYQGMDQMLAELLADIAQYERESTKKTNQDNVTEELEWWAGFRLQEIEHVNEQALLPPRKKRPKHTPERHEIMPVPQEWKKEVQSESIQRMRKAITRQKIDQFVLHKMGNRQKMELKDMAPENVQELMYLGYVYLYGQDGGSAFYLDRHQDRLILHVGPYRFNNHSIMRKTKQNNT